jgi:hypothetical protein
MIDYFQPDNPIAAMVVLALWAGFAAWLLTLVYDMARIGRAAQIMRSLTAAIPDLHAQQNDWRQQSGHNSPRQVFRETLPDGVSHSHPLARHLESIFSAGCHESRLDVGELLRTTEHRFPEGDSVRRNFLSLFLVVGLLGTLFGLADSILSLLRLMETDSDVSRNLAALLGSLKGAFAPSISGVLASVVGTVVYSVYHKVAVAPLVDALRTNTLDIWVPALYPTTGQIAAEAAQKSMEAASKVAAFAQSIEQDSSRLREAVRSAAEFTESYKGAMSSLAESVKESSGPVRESLELMGVQLGKFAEAAVRWAAFEEKISGFYQTVAGAQEKLLEYHTKLREQVEHQTQSLSGLSSSLEAAHKEALESVEETFAEFTQQLAGLQAPFNNAADKMVDQAANLQKYSQTTFETVLQDAKNQIAAIQSVKDAIEALEKHVAGIQSVKDAVDALTALVRMQAPDAAVPAYLAQQTQILQGIHTNMETVARASAKWDGTRRAAAAADTSNVPWWKIWK